MIRGREDLEKYTAGCPPLKNFIPSQKGPVERRPGLKIIRYKHRGLWRRLVAWWRGEPTLVSQMITYGDPERLYVGTDRGLFYLDKDQILKPVPIATPTAGAEA